MFSAIISRHVKKERYDSWASCKKGHNKQLSRKKNNCTNSQDHQNRLHRYPTSGISDYEKETYVSTKSGAGFGEHDTLRTTKNLFIINRVVCLLLSNRKRFFFMRCAKIACTWQVFNGGGYQMIHPTPYKRMDR